MSKLSKFHNLLRLSIVTCTALVSLTTASAPALGQGLSADSPPAQSRLKSDGLIVIQAGELPGRKVNDDEIDIKGCLQNTISDTLKTTSKNEASLSTQGDIKNGVYLCGSGLAIDKQVIIAGTTKDFATVMDSKTGLSLRKEIAAYNPDRPNELGINLFTITDGTSVVDKINTINIYWNEKLKTSVIATPNYVTASKRTAVNGGSPSIGGSPSGPKGLSRTLADFQNQWAFKAIQKPTSPDMELTGKGVVVGIFDAFCTPAKYLLAEGTVVNTTQFASIDASFETNPVTKKRIDDICAHGEFVWSLSHAVAPDADYYFYPVLDNYGLGDTVTLIAALEQFITTTKALESRKGLTDLQGVVINLSLNVDSIRGATVAPLESEIAKLIKMGATVVAAAGNDSSNGIRPMAIPAAYTNVIGVGAVNIKNQRASYSNWVPSGGLDISAPGGEGDCRTVAGVPGCVVGKDSSLQTLCRLMVRGVCIGPYRSVAGYRAWAGTSFATPLVSGLAALVIQQGKLAITPFDVAKKLAGNASNPPAPGTDDGIGEGIISVGQTVP